MASGVAVDDRPGIEQPAGRAVSAGEIEPGGRCLGRQVEGHVARAGGGGRWVHVVDLRPVSVGLQDRCRRQTELGRGLGRRRQRERGERVGPGEDE